MLYWGQTHPYNFECWLQGRCDICPVFTVLGGGLCGGNSMVPRGCRSPDSKLYFLGGELSYRLLMGLTGVSVSAAGLSLVVRITKLWDHFFNCQITWRKVVTMSLPQHSYFCSYRGFDSCWGIYFKLRVAQTEKIPEKLPPPTLVSKLLSSLKLIWTIFILKHKKVEESNLFLLTVDKDKHLSTKVQDYVTLLESW